MLDIDPRNGGNETLDELIKQHGNLPATLKVNTGGDGEHFYFRHPGKEIKGRQNALGTGIDFKADGGYIVAPSSLHASGKSYQWAPEASPDDLELAPMPEWLIKLMDIL